VDSRGGWGVEKTCLLACCAHFDWPNLLVWLGFCLGTVYMSFDLSFLCYRTQSLLCFFPTLVLESHCSHLFCNFPIYIYIYIYIITSEVRCSEPTYETCPTPSPVRNPPIQLQLDCQHVFFLYPFRLKTHLLASTVQLAVAACRRTADHGGADHISWQ
jgi:hypothetical protein